MTRTFDKFILFSSCNNRKTNIKQLILIEQKNITIDINYFVFYHPVFVYIEFPNCSFKKDSVGITMKYPSFLVRKTN